MKAFGRALPVVLLVLATSACGGDDHERLLAGWERDGRGAPGLQVDRGESHCEWDDALILSVWWPPGPDGGEKFPLVFVRDPQGVMDDYTAESFTDDGDLPDDAVATGYENDDAGAELWLADDFSTAHVVTGDRVEAWPALSGALCA